MTSAYPASVDALIPQARRLADELGELPSRNKLMGQFKIGAKKATQILTALTDSDTDTTPERVSDVDTDTADMAESVRRLHAVPDPAATETAPEPAETGQDAPVPAVVAGEPAESGQVTPAVDLPGSRWFGWARRLPAAWPLVLLALPAFVAIWSGWVGLGELTGFGLVHPLPGIADGFTLNTAITLPVGVETYAAYALRVALASGGAATRARRFAGWSAVASLVLGAAGQVAYHLMTVHHITSAPWPITTAVSCLPVLVLGCGAALSHLQRRTSRQEVSR
ncbi:MAG TPA: ABC transporter permease [Pseudonocardiaceae bacterium]|jgi:hypothetical protein|nr:ABC transporter permease [Pseudonocardiaceae bacterium]